MPSYTPLMTWIAVVLVVLEFSALPLITRRRKVAAKIQETFDCELLRLEWDDMVGSKPTSETITAAVQRFREQRPPEKWEELKNWYTTPALGSMPLHQARVACQKENIAWDLSQRREYARWVYAAIAVFVGLIITVGIIADWSLQQFFGGPILLALPVVTVGLKHARDRYERLTKGSGFTDGT